MRPFSIVLLISLLLPGCTSPPASSRGDRPNVVILFADDLGYGDLGVYGHPTIRTPNLDRMAAEGMKFTQFYVGASVCTPSRAALLTGRLPIRSGMVNDRFRVIFPPSEGGLPADEITLAEALKTAGYTTACFGKWHLGHQPEHLPPNQGFDHYFGVPYSNDMSAVIYPHLEERGYTPLPLVRGTETIEEEPDQRLLTRRYTEEAIQFIRDNKDRPFFLYLPHTFPHVPLFASDAFEGKSPRGLYGDVVEELDWSTGQILATLRDLGLAENTFVFFTSDNGPWLTEKLEGGSAGLLKDGKGTTWEGGMRVPCVMRWPKRIKAGQTCRQVVSTIKALLRGETVAFGSSLSERIEDPDAPGPPVLIAASGPKAIRLAGEIGDGDLVVRRAARGPSCDDVAQLHKTVGVQMPGGHGLVDLAALPALGDAV
ncbi:MAG: LLM class flavin-dependent oxidoreductase, partial [Bacteroidetes bacterium]|nr:LLM class flavin-dependent oxidoreductase [Bacteroidota bacterium]